MGTEKKKILIADDEPVMLSEMKDILSYDYHVLTASDGAEAVKAIKSFKPNLAILDVGMPNMSGLEACRSIKQDSKTSHIPVMIMSGKGGILDIEKGFKSGADTYVVKPFSAQKFMDKIEQVLERAEIRGKPGHGSSMDMV